MSSTKASCLLAIVVIMMIGAASAAKPLPGSCLVAASTLCANADTHAMRCLRKLAIKGDARVPAACAEAIMGGVTLNPRHNKEASRTTRLARMLNEAGTCNGANTCPGDWGSVPHNRCNDVLTGCASCSLGTFTVSSGSSQITVGSGSAIAQANFVCSNVCCKAESGGPACCYSSHSSCNVGVN